MASAKDNTDPTKAPHKGQPKASGGKAGTGQAPNRPDSNTDKRTN